MTSSRIHESILVLIAFAVGAGSLLVASSALAQGSANALFRIEQRWHGFPDPPVTPGGAGMYQGYLIPYTLGIKGYVYLPETAMVEPFNPIGGAFELPQSVFTSYFTDVLTPMVNWPGYTTTYYYHVYNGPGKFEPNFGYSTPKRIFFPTTLGNAAPNAGLGNPNLPTVGGGLCADGLPGGTATGNTGFGCGTATFDGRYDVFRGGSLHVTPGANRFGGTYRLFFLDTAHWDQYISYFTPFLYSGYGSYFCFDDGMYDCTPNTHVSEVGTTQIYNGIWWLLTELGKNKAVTPRTSQGTTPTMSTTPTYVGVGTENGAPASYDRRSQHYLNLIHPWTTGYAKAVQIGNLDPGTGTITPQATGYDITLSGATITVKKKNYNQAYKHSISTTVTTISTPYTQTLTGVTRVVSMVRPRLTWTMAVPLDPNDEILNIWSPVRMRNLKVYFLPEPAGMLMLGVGSAALLGLFRMRRR
jgi:hypothetical protein